MTRNPEIPMAKSLVDYIFRYLAMEFVPGYRQANAPKRAKQGSGFGVQGSGTEATTPPLPSAGEGRGEAERPNDDLRPHAKKQGNGHGPRLDPDPHKHLDYGDAADQSTLTDDALRALHDAHLQAPEVGAPTPSGPNLRLAIVSDPLSQQGTELQADAPACDVCGSITVRSGTCYKCLNCGNSMGCS
jgi:ribonucleoside-diphosphate reductase alpha chain